MHTTCGIDCLIHSHELGGLCAGWAPRLHRSTSAEHNSGRRAAFRCPCTCRNHVGTTWLPPFVPSLTVDCTSVSPRSCATRSSQAGTPRKVAVVVPRPPPCGAPLGTAQSLLRQSFSSPNTAQKGVLKPKRCRALRDRRTSLRMRGASPRRGSRAPLSRMCAVRNGASRLPACATSRLEEACKVGTPDADRGPPISAPPRASKALPPP